MSSQIDPTKPEQGQATTASVRANFEAAKLEIEALQAAVPQTAASQAEMEAGTETELRSMSPANVRQTLRGAIYIAANGNVGIGTPTPTEKLDVAGSMTVSGVIKTPNSPAFQARLSSIFTGPGILPFNDAPINRGNAFNINTNRFTAPVAGIYYFHYHNNHAGPASALYADFYKNGGFIGYGRLYTYHTGSGWEELVGSVLIDLQIGDYVQIFLNTSHTADAGIYSSFSGHLIG